jgi:hypothetical protein
MACEARGAARPHPPARAAPRTGIRAETLEPLGAGRWRAWVDFAIDETVKGMPVKQTLLRYPLEVVRMEVDPEHNPWGLALEATGRRSRCGSARTRGSRRFAAPRLDLNLPRTARRMMRAPESLAFALAVLVSSPAFAAGEAVELSEDLGLDAPFSTATTPPESFPIEHLRWSGTPIPLALPVGKDRVLRFPNEVRVGPPGILTERLQVTSEVVNFSIFPASDLE